MSRQSAGVNLPVTHKEITHTLSLSLSFSLPPPHFRFVDEHTKKRRKEQKREERETLVEPSVTPTALIKWAFSLSQKGEDEEGTKAQEKKVDMSCEWERRAMQSEEGARIQQLYLCVCVCAYYACTVLTSQSSQVQGLFRCFLPASFILITLAEKCLWIKRREEEEEEEEKKKKFIDRNADDWCFFFKFYFVFFVVFGIMRIPLPLLTDSDLVEWMNENGSRGSSLPAWPGPARPSPALSLVVKNGPSDA